MNQQNTNDDWQNANQRNKQGYGAKVQEDIDPELKDVYVPPMSVSLADRVAPDDCECEPKRESMHKHDKNEK